MLLSPYSFVLSFSCNRPLRPIQSLSLHQGKDPARINHLSLPLLGINHVFGYHNAIEFFGGNIA